MVDKPKGNVEILVDRFFQWCKNTMEGLDKKTFHHRKTVNTFRGNHPRIAKTMVVTVCTLAIGLVIVGFAAPKTVTVKIDDSITITTTNYETTSLRVDTFIENHQIDYVSGQDAIDVDLHDNISNNMEIRITKAVDIPVTVDGETEVITILPTTVEEILKKLNVEVGENDIVEPALDKTLGKGDSLQVKRVIIEQIVEEEDTTFATKHVPDPNMVIGKTQVVQEGAVGRAQNTYTVVFVDGVETSKTLDETVVLTEKKDKIIAYGMNMKTGTPAGLKYKTKISGVRAVSYHFSGNPRGAFGLPCTYGTCAVDKKVIPLGSLIYVENYGYAIANDVGSGIKGNTIDLYMEDMRQCYKWGARKVNVYVID